MAKIIDANTGESLIPVIAVDGVMSIRAIRMQAYANQAAIEATFECGNATFWSRSSQGLWTKGESSGNLLVVRGAYTDCDSDCLILDVSPVGPT